MLTNSPFKTALRHVDQALKTRPAHPSPPPELHANIMRAVQNAAREQVQDAQAQPAITVWLWRTGWRWTLASSVLLVALIAPLFLRSPSRIAGNAENVLSPPASMANLSTPPLHPPGEVVAVGFAPLAQEMELVSQDVRKAAEFLVASLPFASAMQVEEMAPEL